MKYIMVTGSAGFIGVNLCKRLLLENDNFIYGVDNYITTIPNELNTIIHERFKFINCNIINDNILDTIDTIDYIYHLASIASPPKYKKYPIETLDCNIIGTKNILELVKKHKCKFILTSTSEVYGDPLEHPQQETYYGNVNTVGERSCYDESKRCAETYVYIYRQLYNLDVKICRIFNTYGPYMDIDDGRVITNFIKNILNNKPIIVYGDGSQTRSFCYIDDMIDGLILLMNSNEHGPINLGNPDTEFTLNELHKIFEEVLNKKIDIIYNDITENDPKCRKPDISMAINKLNFNPKINLKMGILNTYNFYSNNF